MLLPATIARDDHRHIVVHLRLAREGDDICEQVRQERLSAIDRAAGNGRLKPRISELLAGAAQLKIMISSREALHIYGEHELCVSPLALPDLRRLPPLAELTQVGAIALFVEHAQASKLSFTFTSEHAEEIAQICLLLDGLPLTHRCLPQCGRRAGRLRSPRRWRPRLWMSRLCAPAMLWRELNVAPFSAPTALSSGELLRQSTPAFPSARLSPFLYPPQVLPASPVCDVMHL